MRASLTAQICPFLSCMLQCPVTITLSAVFWHFVFACDVLCMDCVSVIPHLFVCVCLCNGNVLVCLTPLLTLSACLISWVDLQGWNHYNKDVLNFKKKATVWVINCTGRVTSVSLFWNMLSQGGRNPNKDFISILLTLYFHSSFGASELWRYHHCSWFNVIPVHWIITAPASEWTVSAETWVCHCYFCNVEVSW